jgi:hypothetical protein
MTITTDDRCPGESESLFRPDDVHDALPLIAESKVCKAKVFDILLEREALGFGIDLVDEGIYVFEVFARRGRNVLGVYVSSRARCIGQNTTYMVDGCQSTIRSSDNAASVLQAFESLLYDGQS